MRALVTGARGFVGRQVLPHLVEAGFEVHAATRGPVDQEGWHQVDLLEPGAPERLVAEVSPTHLLHLAWVTTPGRFWTSEDNPRWEATSKSLFEAFVQGGGRRIVAAGSCAEYDWAGGTCEEGSTALQAGTLYGQAKNRTRAALQEIAESWAWGRLFWLYGPHEDPNRLVPGAIRALLRGEQAECRAGPLVRDYMHSEDAGRAFAQLLASSLQGPVNVASGVGVELTELVAEIGRAVGAPKRVKLAERCDPNQPPRVEAGVSRLTDELGFAPRWDLAAGLSSVVDWWRERESS